MPQSHRVKVQKTAHYYTIGTANAQTKRFWIACHGYGQAADRLIQKFEEIDDGTTFIVAPEGLSRFYFGGLKGIVGGSWMTKKDRLIEIEDYCNWLNWIYDHFRQQLPPDVEITFFGFSQGVATIFRWMHARQRDCHNIIIWAGAIPEDITFPHLKEYFATKTILNVYGNSDEFITPQKIEEQNQIAATQNIQREIIIFEGKHRVDRPTLRLVNKRLLEQKTSG